MPVRDLTRDSDGRLILPGRVTKVLTAPFGIDGVTTLPAWLTAQLGTAVVNTQATGTGEVVLTSPSGSSGQLTTGLIDISKFEAVLWEAEGVYVPDVNLNAFGLGLQAANFGFYITFSAAANSGQGSVYGKCKPAATILSQVQFDTNTNHWWQNRHNLGILYIRRSGHVYVMMGDQVLGDLDYSGGTGSMDHCLDGPVNATVSITPNAATVTALHVEQLRLTTVSY